MFQVISYGNAVLAQAASKNEATNLARKLRKMGYECSVKFKAL